MGPTLLIVVAVLAALLVAKRVGQVSAGKVPDLLSAEAVVVDVRSEAEYAGGHIEGAVNVPLNRFKEEIEAVAEDKGAPLLLHCASGGRSAMARRIAVGMGFTDVHNLGSYGRARRLVGDRDSTSAQHDGG